MNKLKCIGSKCPYYKEHEFRMSYFKCGLDGYSYRKDSYQERECEISKIIYGKQMELLELENLLEMIKESLNDERNSLYGKE